MRQHLHLVVATPPGAPGDVVESCRHVASLLRCLRLRSVHASHTMFASCAQQHAVRYEASNDRTTGVGFRTRQSPVPLPGTHYRAAPSALQPTSLCSKHGRRPTSSRPEVRHIYTRIINPTVAAFEYELPVLQAASGRARRGAAAEF